MQPKQSSQPASPSIPIHATLDEWLQQEAIPFALDSPAMFNSAVDRVIASLAGSVDSPELLGFGEALHGGEDILLIRNRLFQRLVEAHGYSAIAIESSFPRGRAANDYVAGHGPVSYDALQERGFSHGFGRIEANRELLEWMRRYNTDPAHSVKLRFYGFDSPTEMGTSDSPRHLLYFVLEYLTAMDDACGRRHRERVDSLLGEDASWEDPAALADPAKSIGLSPAATALRLATEDLITELHIRRPEWIEKSNEGLYGEAVHYASMARQLLIYHAALATASGDRTSRLLGMRDAMMADNLAYIVARERGSGKVLAFAHNSHLRRGKARWQWGTDEYVWWTAGSHLNEMFGPRYAVIGSGVGVSEENGIGQPEAGTLEARLTALPGPVRFIPTRRGHGLPAREIAALPTRTGSMKNPTYFALTPESLTDFDGLAVLDSTTYSRGGPTLP